jgi:AraC family transcriptional regulator
MDHVLHIKNMVCYRCILTVKGILDDLDLPYNDIKLGEVHFEKPLSEDQKKQIKDKLEPTSLELIDNRLNQLIEKAKNLIIQKARNEVPDEEKKHKMSSYLADKLAIDYSYLSNLFSSVEGRTIEKYFIEQRIEKAKELLVYGQLNLSEIAYQLDYSSVAHLSSQFKKTTGLTPSHFKEIGKSKLKSLDQI